MANRSPHFTPGVEGSRRVGTSQDLLSQGTGTIPRGPPLSTHAKLLQAMFSEEENSDEESGSLVAAAARMDRVQYQGVLIKSPPIKFAKQSSMKAWKRRWFVLREPSGLLEYYKDELSFQEGEKPKGTVDIWKSSHVEPVADHPRYSHLFKLETNDRTFYLSPPGKAEMDAWIAQLRVAIGRRNEAKAAAVNVLQQLGHPAGTSSKAATLTKQASLSGAPQQAMVGGTLGRGASMQAPAFHSTPHHVSVQQQQKPVLPQAPPPSSRAPIPTPKDPVRDELEHVKKQQERLIQEQQQLLQQQQQRLRELELQQQQVMKQQQEMQEQMLRKQQAMVAQPEPAQPPRPPKAAPAVVHEDTTHLSRPWFVGLVSREEMEKELSECDSSGGVFAVRESARAPGQFALSICLQGKISHCKVDRDAAGYFLDVSTGTGRYPSLTALIESQEIRDMLSGSKSKKNQASDSAPPPRPPKSY